MLRRSFEIWLALGFLVIALLCVFWWIPSDTQTAPIYRFRRQVLMGDALLPLVAAAGLAICAAIHLVGQLRARDERRGAVPFDARTGVFLCALAAILAVSLAVMFWAGPVAVALFAQGADAPVSYRELRGTFPWRHVGFVLGGIIMVFGAITLLDGRPTRSAAISAVLAVVALILVFDVAFESVLLPPNGEF